MTFESISTTTLLQTLTDSVKSAATAFPDDQQQLLPPDDGISLLDTKNELLLSYLQNLVFLIILRLRDGPRDENNQDLTTATIRKLIEYRVYLERGVRPLEQRLKYQVDQVLRAAEEAEARRGRLQEENRGENGARNHNDEHGSGQDSEAAEPDEGLGTITDLSYRPNISQLVKKAETSSKFANSSDRTSGATYKPPRITPTSMPTPPSERLNQQPRKRKSQLLDEYIDEELSTAPQAQPSIGSNNTIIRRGQGVMSKRDKDKERERTDYEERNFTRLPSESKVEKRKQRLQAENDRRDMFGGEDWTGLGGLGDRVSKSVTNRSGGEGVLERRQKRKRATEDLPRGDGNEIGAAFENRKRILQQRAEKKSRRK